MLETVTLIVMLSPIPASAGDMVRSLRVEGGGLAGGGVRAVGGPRVEQGAGGCPREARVGGEVCGQRGGCLTSGRHPLRQAGAPCSPFRLAISPPWMASSPEALAAAAAVDECR